MHSAGPIAPARSGVFLAGDITIQPLAVDTLRSTGAEYAMPPASTFSGTVLRAERAGEDPLALHLMVRPATWSTPSYPRLPPTTPREGRAGEALALDLLSADLIRPAHRNLRAVIDRRAGG